MGASKTDGSSFSHILPRMTLRVPPNSRACADEGRGDFFRFRTAGVFGVLFCGMLSSCAPTDGEAEFSYADVEPIIFDKCLRCHGNPRANGAPVSFTTYEQVYSKRNAIEDHVGTIGDMPPTFLMLDPPVEDLTRAERDTLLSWLSDGAPE